ncbi:MAG TPA: VWA domain-containing protein [Candidatus Angelobacter sp.]|nr:VWA domain-containing protein [Candidatus Angelobacter sp.]
MHNNKQNGDLIRISLAVVLLCLLLVGAKMRGQNKADMTVHVKVVNVPATVRDKHGKIVNNLTKDDFVLEEDGRPQTLHYFSQENSLPLTLGLLVDTSQSQRRVLGQERTASSSFIDQMLRPDKDKAFLIHFDHEVELDQDLTSSQEQLRSALASLQSPQFTQTSGGNSSGQGSGGYPGRRGGRQDGASRGGGTLLYDAVFLASDELMKKQTGRKALIILSDGDDRGSKETLRTAIETAQRADTIIYSILFKDEEDHSFGGGFGGIGGMGGHHGGPGGGRDRYPQEARADGKKILEQMSRETGGRLFEVSGKQSVEKIYAQIEEDLRNQYSLGYTPDRTSPGEGFHKISVKTKQKDLVVHAREEYYWGP